MPRPRPYGGGKAGQPMFSVRGEPDPPPDQKYRAPTQPLEQRLEEIRPAIAGFTSAMPLVRRRKRPDEAFGEGDKFLGMSDLLGRFLRCNRGASSPIVAGVANLHASDLLPVKLWGDDTGLDKVLSEGRMYATMP
jgi:hypothetical protein